MRAKKSDKFFVYAPKKSGFWKDKRLLGINSSYEGGTDTITIQDLVDFLKEKGIDPAKIVLPRGFVIYAKV